MKQILNQWGNAIFNMETADAIVINNYEDNRTKKTIHYIDYRLGSRSIILGKFFDYDTCKGVFNNMINFACNPKEIMFYIPKEDNKGGN